MQVRGQCTTDEQATTDLPERIVSQLCIVSSKGVFQVAAERTNRVAIESHLILLPGDLDASSAIKAWRCTVAITHVVSTSFHCTLHKYSKWQLQLRCCALTCRVHFCDLKCELITMEQVRKYCRLAHQSRDADSSWWLESCKRIGQFQCMAAF